MANEDDRTGVTVTFLDQTGAKSVEAVVSPTVTVARIIPQHHHQDELASHRP